MLQKVGSKFLLARHTCRRGSDASEEQLSIWHLILSRLLQPCTVCRTSDIIDVLLECRLRHAVPAVKFLITLSYFWSATLA